MKKLKAITKKVTSNSSHSKNATHRIPSIRGQASDQAIKVVRGGYSVDLTHVDETFTQVHRICLLNKNEDSLHKLLQSGADANVVDRVTGSAPLHLSVVVNNAAFVRILLANGASIDLKDGKGKTALMKAIETENVEMARFLIYNKANPNVADDEGDTPIFVALRNCFIECTRLLIQPSSNVNLNVLNRSHQLPLHLIANSNGLNEFLPRIVEATVNVDIQDSAKMTPLMLASSCGNKMAVQALLTRKADTGITNPDGLMAYDLAKANGFMEICSLIETASQEKASESTATSKLINSQINKAVLMNWTDSEDSSLSEEEIKSVPVANKINEKKQQSNIQNKKESSGSIHSSKRPSYGSVIEELNKLPTNKSNGNIQPSIIRKSQLEKQMSKESQSSSGSMVDLQLKKLEASFMALDSDENSISPSPPVTGLTSDEKIVKTGQTSGATSDSPMVNDQFIQRLRDILDDEIRDSNELDDLLLGDGLVYNEQGTSAHFSISRIEEKSSNKNELNSIHSSIESSESAKSSPSPTEMSKVEPLQLRPTVPTLAPIRSLVSGTRNVADLQHFGHRDSSQATSTSTSTTTTTTSTNEPQNRLDAPTNDSAKGNNSNSKSKSTNNRVNTASIVNQIPKSQFANEKEEKSQHNLPEPKKQFNLLEPLKQLNFTSDGKVNESNIELTLQPPPTNGRDSVVSTREAFELNVKLKEIQSAYESERISRINLESELEILKKNSDSFIRDFHQAFREKMEFENKMYQVQSENSKLNYELEKVKGERDDLVRELNVLREIKENREGELNSIKIERERLYTEKLTLQEQVNQFKDDLVKSVVDDENETKIHQVVQENASLINQVTQLKEQILQLTNESVKLKSQFETELTLRENKIKQITSEKVILLEENELIKGKFTQIQKVAEDSFAHEMGELKDTIEKLNFKIKSENYNQVDSKVQIALDQTRSAIEDLTRQIKLVKEATIRIKEDHEPDLTSDPIDERLQKLQNSIGQLEERMIQQELRIRKGQGESESELELIYPQLVKSLPIGRVPQSAFVRALLQSEDESHSKLIRDITSVKKDLGLFCWSVEQN